MRLPDCLLIRTAFLGVLRASRLGRGVPDGENHPKTHQPARPISAFRAPRVGTETTVRDSRNRVVRDIDCASRRVPLASTGWRQSLLEPRDTLPRESPAQEKQFVSSASVIARYPSHARVAVVARVEASTRRLAKASRFFSSGVAKFSRSRTSTRKSGRTGLN